MIKEKYTERIKEISLNISQSRVDSIRQKDISKTGLRVYEDGYIGCAGAIGDYDEKELEEKAISSLEYKIPYNSMPGENMVRKEDFYTEIIPEDKIVAEMDELLSILREEQPDFIFFNKINLTERELSIVNNKGLDLSYRDKYMDFSLAFKEKTSVNIFDGGVGFRGRKYDRIEVVNAVNDICNAYKNKVELPKEGILPVVFSADDPSHLGKFLAELDGNKLGSNSSLFSGKLGQKLFSENFTLYQTNNPELQPVSFFDAEGTVNENYSYTLIEEGILRAPYTDKRAATKYNLPLTGAATGEYDEAPLLGRPMLMIKESEKTAKELLNGEMGIFVFIATGGDFSPEGNFGTPVQLAFLFDGERFVGRLPELNISSNVFDMFGDSFIGVSNNDFMPMTNSKVLVMKMKVSR